MRGFWYMIEAILAGFIIVTFLLVARTEFILGTVPQYDVTLKAYDILRGLDDQELLRNYTINEDPEGLNLQVKFYTYNHSIEICSYSGTCVGSEPNATNVWTGYYVIAGDDTVNYKPYEIRLYIYSD